MQIERQQLAVLRDQGFSAVHMAQHLGCSVSLVYKHLAAEDLRMRDKYSTVSDAVLDSHTEAFHQSHSSAGNEVRACRHVCCTINYLYYLKT